MVNSPIFTYYKGNEPEMLENIRKQKLDYGYKSASRNLFKFEVDLMTEVIKRLNKKGVYVLYVYDALYCAASDCDSVKRVMDEVAVEFEVMTKVARYTARCIDISMIFYHFDLHIKQLDIIVRSLNLELIY